MDKQAAYELGVELALRDAGIVKEAGLFDKANPLSHKILELLRTPTAKGIGAGALGGGALGGGLGGDPESVLKGALIGAGVGGGAMATRSALGKTMSPTELASGEYDKLLNLGTALGGAGGGLLGSGLSAVTHPRPGREQA
jgi:hypothetical protein